MLTQSRLKEMLHYDPKTGVFTRKVSSTNAVKVGDVAGNLNIGYTRISVDNKVYLAHRLAWLYVHGYMPESQIEHIDRGRSHNWIANLRPASQQCNMRNRANFKNNKSGIKGVHWSKSQNKWIAQIKINYKAKHLGCFNTKLGAAKARLKAEQETNWSGCDSLSPAYQYVKNAILSPHYHFSKPQNQPANSKRRQRQKESSPPPFPAALQFFYPWPQSLQLKTPKFIKVFPQCLI